MKIIGKTSDYTGFHFRKLSDELKDKIKEESRDIQLTDFTDNVIDMCMNTDYDHVRTKVEFLEGFSISPKLLGLDIPSNSSNNCIVKDYPFLIGDVHIKLTDENSVKVKLMRNIVHSSGSFDILIHIQSA